ncbi:MAG: hypothetical protein ONA90_05945, partial [candidate division KSB1 bacterium]|nr:hypothetical protein [candidate division KSB1 bacterium]
MKYPTSRLQATIRRGIFLFLLLPLPLLQAQAELSGTREEIHPLFYVDLVSFRSEKPHHSRLDIYLKIMYDDLQFTKLAADSFRAIYEVSAIISDEDDFQINGRTWRDTVIVKSFDATNSRTMFRFGETRFDLPPDKYRVSVGVTDVDTRRTAYRKSQVVVREFSKDKLSLSDVLIADGTSPDSSGLIIPHPQVAAPRREGSRLFAFFEIYDTSESKEYELSYSLKNLKGEKVFQRQAMVQHTGQITPVVAELPNHQLAHGVYLIRIDAKTDHSKAYTEREIVLHWVGIPPNIVDLDKAIEQMRYIAKKDGLKKIKSAPPEKRREAFLQF